MEKNYNKIKNKLKKNKIIYKIILKISNYIWKIKMRRRNKILKNYGMETLIFTQNLLLEKNFSFFIAFGTLLGIIREKQLLEFDIDLDIALFGNNIDWKYLEKILKNNGFKKKHEFYFQDKIFEQSYDYKGIVIDFFHSYIKNKKLILKSFARYSKITYQYENMFSTKVYFVEPFKKIISKKINTRIFYIPDNFEEHLREVYGKDWQIPDKNWKEEKSLSLEVMYNKYVYIRKNN